MLDSKQKQQLIDDYQNGTVRTILQATAKYHINEKSVSAMLTEAGVIRSQRESLRLRFPVNEGAFDEQTDEMAYWAGLMMTDGCVFRGSGQASIHLWLQEGDREHVEAFGNFLGRSAPLRERKPGSWGKAAQVGFSVASDQLADSLSRYGVVPRKTMNAKVIKLENNPHFWRGAIDGDGSIYVGGRTGDFPVVSLCSASMAFIMQFIGFIKSVVPEYNPGTPKMHKSAYQGRVSGHGAISVLRAMYQPGCPALSRKADKAKDIIRRADTDPDYCPRRGLSNEQEEKALSLYLRGKSLRRVAKKFKTDNATIRRIATRHGISIRPNPKPWLGKKLSKRTRNRMRAARKAYLKRTINE